MEQGSPDQVRGVPESEDEVSLLEILNLLLRRRRVIIASVFIAGLLGVVMGLLQSGFQYTSTFSFLPNSGEQRGLAGVASLAQQFGFSVPRSGGAQRSPEFYEELLGSREILDGVVSGSYSVVVDDEREMASLSRYFEVESETEAERLARTRRLLSGLIQVTVTRTTGIVEVSVTTNNAELSAAIASRLLELVSSFDVDTRQSQASAERRFAEERVAELRRELTVAEDSLKAFLSENRQFTNSPQLQFEHDRLQRQVAMRQELVTAMAQAYEQARIDEVRNTPVITVVEEPEVPALPNARGRLRRLMLLVILGGMLGVGLAFVSEFRARAKEAQDEEWVEFRSLLDETRSDLTLGRRRSRSSGSAGQSAEN